MFRRRKEPQKKPLTGKARRKAHLGGLHPRLQEWIQLGERRGLLRRHAWALQTLINDGRLRGSNLQLVLFETNATPHTLGVHAEKIVRGDEQLQELIRLAVRAQELTVPKEAVGYVLNQPKGEFGSSLRRLVLEHPKMPELLQYKIVLSRSRQKWVQKGVSTAVWRLSKTRERLEHELHSLNRTSHPKREARMIRKEMREVEIEMQDIIHRFL